MVGALLILSGLIHVAILVAAERTWVGPVSLRKPATFGLSFGVTLITITWVTSFLRLGKQTRRALLGTFTGACVLETVLVSLQAWRHVPSHFNVETPFDAGVARLLAAGGFTLIVTITAFAISSFRANAAVPVSILAAIRFGFASLCVSLIVGAVMIARGMTLVFAGSPQTAYLTGGILKATHAVTMHAILVLPALAWLLSRTHWSEPRRLRIVLAAAGAYVVLIAVVLIGDVA